MAKPLPNNYINIKKLPNNYISTNPNRVAYTIKIDPILKNRFQQVAKKHNINISASIEEYIKLVISQLDTTTDNKEGVN